MPLEPFGGRRETSGHNYRPSMVSAYQLIRAWVSLFCENFRNADAKIVSGGYQSRIEEPVKY